MSPIKENLLSITELAKLRQVTSETLRYYDRIGLITPDYVDPQTRYRYYSIRQYEKLGTIKELRQLGMSIHDITDYFSGRNLRKSHQLLLHQLELLEEEIRKQQLLSEILRRKLHFLSEITPPPPVDKVFCRAFPQRYMITFGEPAGRLPGARLCLYPAGALPGRGGPHPGQRPYRRLCRLAPAGAQRRLYSRRPHDLCGA